MVVGELIDLYYVTRQKKYEKNEEVKEINAKLQDLQDKIITALESEGLEKGSGMLATASRTAKVHPQVDNKETFIKWVVANERFDMVQSKVNAAPIREMLDNENLLPEGISTYNQTSLSVTKK